MKPVKLEELESGYQWLATPGGGAMIGNVVTHASGARAGETLAYFCGKKAGYSTADLAGWMHWGKVEIPPAPLRPLRLIRADRRASSAGLPEVFHNTSDNVSYGYGELWKMPLSAL